MRIIKRLARGSVALLVVALALGLMAQQQRGTRSRSIAANTTIGVVGRGVPQLITISNPAAGSDWTFSAGNNAYMVHTVYAVLTTSATAATRTVRIAQQQGGVNGGIWAAQQTQLANLARSYSISSSVPSAADVSTIPIVAPAVFDVLIPPGGSLLSSTVGIQAGDQWSNIALYVEQFPSGN